MIGGVTSKSSKQQAPSEQISSSSQSSEQVQEQPDVPIPDQPDQLQRSFMQKCSEQKQQNKNSNHFCVQKSYSIDQMFILFSFYHDDIIQIGRSHECKSKITLNKIRVISKISKNDAQQCLNKINAYIDKIIFKELNHERKINIISSPYFNQKAKQLGFSMCKFNNKIYCHTNKQNVTQKKLCSAINSFNSLNIFPVKIKTIQSKDRQIYNHYRYFIKKMIKLYDKQQFQQRCVVVQIDTTQININCIGIKQRDLVAAKNLLKNLLQSTVILIVKYESQDGIDGKISQLKQYALNITKFPIVISKVQKRSLTIISKQNILRKFIQKPKVLQQIHLKQKTQIGMFLPRRFNYNQRKSMIQQICLKKGYDFTTLGSIYHFFKKMFIHQDQQINPQQILQLIYQILNTIKQNKQKFQIPTNHRKRIQQQTETFKGEYYSKGDQTRDEFLSKQLRRDVLRQTVIMGKSALVRYRVSDSPESETVYWFINKQSEKILCKIKDMKVGISYFSGKYKKVDQQICFYIEYKYQLL